jgi:hypothetical protein
MKDGLRSVLRELAAQVFCMGGEGPHHPALGGRPRTTHDATRPSRLVIRPRAEPSRPAPGIIPRGVQGMTSSRSISASNIDGISAVLKNRALTGTRSPWYSLARMQAPKGRCPR